MFGPCFVLQYLGLIKKISLFLVMGGNILGMVGIYNFFNYFFSGNNLCIFKMHKIIFFQKT